MPAIKNLILFAIGADVPPSAAELAEAMAAATFAPCGATQRTSSGWVPPRGDKHGALVEVVDGQWIMALLTETRILPGAVIARRVEEMAEVVERETGRKPGKKQRREMKDQVQLELLPQAFTRRVRTLVWIDPKARRVGIVAPGAARGDVAASHLVAAWPKMNVHKLRVQRSVERTMATWLLEEPPSDFTVDRDAVLESAEDSKAVVRYQRHSLSSPDVREHLMAGKVPTRLAMTFVGRVSFLLNDDMHLQRIEIGDSHVTGSAQERADAFDADITIATGELTALIDTLLEELGGVALLPIETAASAEPTPAAAAVEGEGEDELIERALAIVTKDQRASISLVQRELRIGYNRAARLLEALEQRGAVSAMDSEGRRKVLAAACPA